MLRLRGLKGLQEYLLSEVIGAYRSQDVGVNDKHVEIIIRQMLKKVKIESSGDTTFFLANLLTHINVKRKTTGSSRRWGASNCKKNFARHHKSIASTESFLSAASFQETSRVLTDAALKGKVDNLTGIKENVIIGKLIPAGTGVKKYREVMPVIVKDENVG